MNNKRSFLDIQDPYKKPEKLKKAQWDPVSGKIEGVLDE